MRFRQPGPNLAKTLSFAVIHLAIAVTLGWLFTGGFVLGGLLALLEPATNTVAAHQLERWWAQRPATRRSALQRSALLAASHLLVAIAVGWLLTGSWIAATAYALVEPLANAVAHYHFDRWWHRGLQPASARSA